MKIEQIRDLTVIDIDENRYLGISCDSCGGIGEKVNDTIKASTVIVGEQTAKVVLAELLSMGFTPITISNGLASEMHDTGEKIIQGFKNTISMLKNNNVHMTGSTEENAITTQTSMGTTGIGIVNKFDLKYKRTKKGDLCVVIGLPLVGKDVLDNPDKVMSIKDFEFLKDSDFVHEIVPVGSKGIDYEVHVLCKYNDMEINYYPNLNVDLKTSGGPSCSCIISININDLKNLKNNLFVPIEIIGVFI